MDECNSWHRSEGGKGNMITGLWPGSTLHALETLMAPRWENFDYESNEENKLKWLGSSWSVTQRGGGPAWYLEPSMMDVPKAGKPEQFETHAARTSSH